MPGYLGDNFAIIDGHRYEIEEIVFRETMDHDGITKFENMMIQVASYDPLED